MVDDVWDAEREETFARQKELGVLPADCDPTKRLDDIPSWDSMSAACSAGRRGIEVKEKLRCVVAPVDRGPPGQAPTKPSIQGDGAGAVLGHVERQSKSALCRPPACMVNQSSTHTRPRRIGRYEKALERQFRRHRMISSHAHMTHDLAVPHRHPGSCCIGIRQPGARIVGPSDGITLVDMHLGEYRGAGFEIQILPLPDEVRHRFMQTHPPAGDKRLSRSGLLCRR